MGILRELILLTEAYPAFEADDITGEAEAAAKNIVGKSTATADAGEDTTAGDDGQDDMGKTDDIFGLNDKNDNKDPDGNPIDNQPDDQNPDSQTDPEGDPTQDDNLDNMDDTSNMGDDNNDASNNDPAYYDRNRLKDNMIQLYRILKSNIALLSELNSKLNDEVSIRACNVIMQNLTSCSVYLYKVITQELEKKSYEDLLKDYISIKRIFDICTEILSKHFDNVSIKLKKKK